MNKITDKIKALKKVRMYSNIIIGMAKSNVKFRQKIINKVTQKFGDRFNIEGKPYSEVSPNIILSDKVYKEPIFSMFIISTNEPVFDKLESWKPYISRAEEKIYILSPEDKYKEVLKYSSLMPGDILLAKYTINSNGKVMEIVYG